MYNTAAAGVVCVCVKVVDLRLCSVYLSTVLSSLNHTIIKRRPFLLELQVLTNSYHSIHTFEFYCKECKKIYRNQIDKYYTVAKKRISATIKLQIFSINKPHNNCIRKKSEQKLCTKIHEFRLAKT